MPKNGWILLNVLDLEYQRMICEMCEEAEIRYVHEIKHPDYGGLRVGCVCCGRLINDPSEAEDAERDVIMKYQKIERFLVSPKWKVSKKGNNYIKINGRIYIIYSSGEYYMVFCNIIDGYSYKWSGVSIKTFDQARRAIANHAFGPGPSGSWTRLNGPNTAIY